jgi:hypothetical protein
MSTTVTEKAQLAQLFDASRAVQVTIVTPVGKFAPAGGTHTVLAPEQLSFVNGAA